MNIILRYDGFNHDFHGKRYGMSTLMYLIDVYEISMKELPHCIKVASKDITITKINHNG